MTRTENCRTVGPYLLVALWLVVPEPTAQGEGPPPELRKLHALLAVDTRSGLGESVAVDGEHIANLLRAGIPRDRLDMIMLTGKDLTAARILQFFQEAMVESTDALLFYYAGHGAIDATKGHWMALQHLETKPLVRDDLKKAMQAKKPGLLVLITDCCSDRVPLPGKKRKIIPEPGEAKELNPVLRCLFFQHRGVVDITADSDDTQAWGDEHEGGL